MGRLTDRLRLSLWSGLVLFLIAVAYLGRIQGGRPGKDVLYQYGTAVAGAAGYVFVVSVVIALAWGRADLLALRPPRSWRATLGLALLLLVGIFVLGAVLDPLLHPGREQGLTPSHWESRHAGAYAANFAVIALVAPFVEELTFRGLGYSLLARFGSVAATVMVGLTFGLAHGLVQALPVLAIFGAALAWLRARTDSVIPGMIVHAAFNAIALVVAVTA